MHALSTRPGRRRARPGRSSGFIGRLNENYPFYGSIARRHSGVRAITVAAFEETVMTDAAVPSRAFRRRPPSPGRAAAASLAPGLAQAGALGAAAIGLGRLGWLQAHGIGALTLAIALGLVAGNLGGAAANGAGAPGVAFARQALLRLGIVLYGLRLTFQDIAQVGLRGVAVDAVMLASTFALAVVLGTRLFGLDRRAAMLIGAGSAICGAAAVMATGPVVRGRAEQVAVAVSTVVVFGTLALFAYPLLYAWNARAGLLALSPSAYGVFAGSTIHEVAQAVAAGHAVGPAAADAAVIAKMVRVMMLAPFLVGLSAWLARDAAAQAGAGARAGGIVVPWFALGFVAAAAANSVLALPAGARAAIEGVDGFVLATAMAGLGLGTRVAALRDAGLRPLGLAAVLAAWLVAGGLAVNLAIGAA